MAKGKKTKKDKGAGADGTQLIASYKRAYRDYEILDTYEAGPRPDRQRSQESP